ncbi:hypothetical protein HQ447_19725 [bacterium]|nr:hypothetical protein [bacterium]
MALYALTNFHESVRALLGDEGDLASGFDYVDAQLNAALRTVIRAGYLPCLSLNGMDNLLSAPLNPDTWGFLAAKAAHILIGGATPVSIRTRALSVMADPAGRRDSMSYIETMLSDIDARGNVCGGAGDTSHKGLFGSVADVVTFCNLPESDNFVIV